MEQTTNYYIDNRTQVVINQPTRTVMVTNEDYNALMSAYNSSISLLASLQKDMAQESGMMVDIMINLIKENTALKAEVKELRSRLYALPK